MPRLVHKKARGTERTEFGDNLRKVRAFNQWTQEKMAEILGITRSSLGSYEEGRALPPVKVQFEIAAKLSIVDVMGFLTSSNFKVESQDLLGGGRGLSPIEERYARLEDKAKIAVNALLGIK